MNQTIEFRAWSKENKEYIYNIHLYLEHKDENGNKHDGYADWKFDDFLTNKNFIVEQYTGLKDKNNMKIFVGDIVNLKDFGNQSINCSQGEYWLGWGMEAMKDNKNNYAKSNTLRDWCGGFSCEGLICGNKNCTNHIEIIGTLHQNPELITENK